jgi:hypothetical protein
MNEDEGVSYTLPELANAMANDLERDQNTEISFASLDEITELVFILRGYARYHDALTKMATDPSKPHLGQLDFRRIARSALHGVDGPLCGEPCEHDEVK